MRNKLIFFILFLAFLVGLVGLWYYQRNFYSKEVLKLEILGPSEIQLLDEVEYTVKYKNNGNVALEDAKLVFEYPEYSLIEDSKPEREEIELEDIYPGQENTFQFKARILGKENEIKKAKATLSYRPKNLQAFYESSTTFSTQIKSVPITFEFDLSSRVEAGRELKFYLNYFSSLNYPLSNLRVNIEYPLGFEFRESSPAALDKTEWEIGLLNKMEGGRIEVKGKLTGEIKEQKIFKATFGVWQKDEFILLKERIKGVEIIKPQLSIFQQINGASDYIANPGDSLHYEIFFRNIGEESFSDLFLVTRLEGLAFDFDSVSSDFGQFNKGDNSIVWDWRKVPELKSLGRGQEGKVDFLVNLKESWDKTSKDEDFVLKNNVIISQVKEEFETKITSKLVIKQAGYFEDEVFGNSGPLPPKVGEATTYTIIWQAKNYYNEVKNVKVKATLAQDVKLTGHIFPEDQSSKFAFDSLSREIVWDIGDFQAGSGVLSPGPSIAFQISFTPSSSHIGQKPDLISEAKITGEDTWTSKILQVVSPAINTTLPDDPTVSEEMGIVQ